MSASGSISPKEVWAKYDGDFYSLPAHLLDTATAAAALWDTWLRSGLRECIGRELCGVPAGEAYTEEHDQSALRQVQLLAALHDIGKANPVFQAQLAQAPELVSWAWGHVTSFDSELEQKRSTYNRLSPDRRFVARRHEIVSALHLAQGEIDYENLEYEEYWPSLVVHAHHGRWKFAFTKDYKRTSSLRDGIWEDVRDRITAQLEEALETTLDDLSENVSPHVTILLSGLTICADRLASGSDWVEKQKEALRRGDLDEDSPQQWLTDSLPAMIQRVHEHLGIFHNSDDPLAQILGNFSPRPAQQLAYASGRGLCTIMAPTGCGKTEAALLRHANEEERIIFLLPTRATANAMMNRLQKCYRATPMIAALAHGTASLEDFYTTLGTHGASTSDDENTAVHGECCDEQGLFPAEFVQRGAAKLLAPVCVGSVDQALMGSLKLKWTPLRLLALANAHIVIDEVHTMDAYQTKLLETLMQWWAVTDTRVTLLSATQANHQFRDLAKKYSGTTLDESFTQHCEFGTVSVLPSNPGALHSRLVGDSSHDDEPIVTTFDIPPSSFSYELVDVNVGEKVEEPTLQNPNLISANQHIRWVSEQLERYPQARLGVFVNRVETAQHVARELHKRLNSSPPDSTQQVRVIVLHARMTVEHRREVESTLNALLGPGSDAERIVVIGTQAIEASLDIDLDLISTDLAPAPSLIQRAGRGWRREDPYRSDRLVGSSESEACVDRLHLHIVYSDLERFSLPYAEPVMRRSLEWLQAHESAEICSPGDVQPFVDHAWVDWETMGSDEELEFLARQSIDVGKAKARTYDLKTLYDDDVELGDYAVLTQQSEVSADIEEAFTRLMEQESITLILDWKWGGDYKDIRAHMPKPVISSALNASVSVSATAIVVAVKKAAEDPDSGVERLEDVPALIRGAYFVKDQRLVAYDEEVGLVMNSTGGVE